MTNLHTENARLRAALAELRRGIAMIHDALATPTRPRQSVGEVAAWWLNYADAALATPAPDAVQEAARVLLSLSNEAAQPALDACHGHYGQVAVKEFLRAIAGDRT